MKRELHSPSQDGTRTNKAFALSSKTAKPRIPTGMPENSPVLQRGERVKPRPVPVRRFDGSAVPDGTRLGWGSPAFQSVNWLAILTASMTGLGQGRISESNPCRSHPLTRGGGSNSVALLSDLFKSAYHTVDKTISPDNDLSGFSLCRYRGSSAAAGSNSRPVCTDENSGTECSTTIAQKRSFTDDQTKW